MIKAGDCVKFGSYPQDLNENVLPIEWKVLAIVEGKALLVSDCGLDVRRFDGETNVWEDSELRRWLNGEFKNRAFSSGEQELIKGEIVVPSWQEAKNLMPNSGYFVRKCDPTPWAKAKGAVTYGGRCFWWTRNHPAGFWNDVDVIGYDGGCYQRCCRAETFCVRPLIRVSVEGLKSDKI